MIFRSLACSFMFAAQVLANSPAAPPPSLARAVGGAHVLADALAAHAVFARQLAAAVAGTHGELAVVLANGHLMLAVHSMTHAGDAWQRADQLAAQLGDRNLQLAVLEKRSEIALVLGDYDRCRVLAERMRGVASAIGHSEMNAIALGYLGILERRRGDIDAAMRHHQKAI